jgi:hypothetical protein
VDFNLNPPFFTTNQFRTSPTTLLTLANPFPTGLLQAAGAPSFIPSIVNRYARRLSFEWTLGVQRQLTKSLVPCSHGFPWS